MSYKVTGAAAVVELDDGKPDLGTGTRVYLEQGVAVPENAKAKHLEHLIAVGLVEKVKDEPKSASDDASADKAAADAKAKAAAGAKA